MGGTKASTPAPVDLNKQAEAQMKAQLDYMPQAAQLQYDIQANPQYGMQATTQLAEDTRRNVLPNETAVRDQYVQNILAQLTNPNFISSEEQAYVDQARQRASGNLQESMRTQANLGGGLYGGRTQAAEARTMGDLQGQFAEQDIARRETNRLNTSQLATQILQLLYPQSGIQQANFVNPVASADNQFSGAVSQRNMDAQIAMQNAANQSALYGSLFEGLGGAAGGALGGAFGAGGVWGQEVK